MKGSDLKVGKNYTVDIGEMKYHGKEEETGNHIFKPPHSRDGYYSIPESGLDEWFTPYKQRKSTLKKSLQEIQIQNQKPNKMNSQHINALVHKHYFGKDNDEMKENFTDSEISGGDKLKKDGWKPIHVHSKDDESDPADMFKMGQKYSNHEVKIHDNGDHLQFIARKKTNSLTKSLQELEDLNKTK